MVKKKKKHEAKNLDSILRRSKKGKYGNDRTGKREGKWKSWSPEDNHFIFFC